MHDVKKRVNLDLGVGYHSIKVTIVNEKREQTVNFFYFWQKFIVIDFLPYQERKDGSDFFWIALHNRTPLMWDVFVLAFLKHTVDCAFNFVDGNKTSIQEYKYDASGNLEQDYNKKIANIQYNSLNLPSTLQFANGNSTDYLYGADGMKRRVTHKTTIANISVPMGQIIELANSQISQTNTTDYCNNVIYENGVLSMILTEEGYVTLNGDTPIYHYYLKDHQGNNRIVMNQNGTTVEQVNHYYPFGGLFGEGIATSNQNYKYNGKELNCMHGLDWYDYGARMYDAALGRWHVGDSSSEKYYEISPFVYCKNNPILRVDIDGKDDYVVNQNGFVYHYKATKYEDEGDRVYYFNGSNKPKQVNGEPIVIMDNKLMPDMVRNQSREGGISTYGKTNSIRDATNLFKFAADNSIVEWKLDV